MRVTALLLIGLLPTLGGCSSTRWNLTQSGDRKPPPSADNVEYKYGNPWAKSAKNKTDHTPAAPAGLPPDLEAKLAEAKARKNDVSELLKAAAQAELRGDLEAAKQSYLKVLESQPRNAEAHHRLAVIADQQQDHRTADHHYQQALALDRQNADLLSDLGYSHFLRGNLDQSERYLKEALEVDHYHQAAIWHLGHVYLRQGKPDAALTMFRQVRTEREAQQIVAEAFPERGPTGSEPARGMGPRWDEFLDSPRADTPTGTPPAQTATLTQLAGSLSPSVVPGTTTSPAVISPWNSSATEPSSSTTSRSAAPTFSAHSSGTSQPVQTAAAEASNDSFWQGALTNSPTPNPAGGTSLAATAPASSLAAPQGRTPLPPMVTPGLQATTVPLPGMTSTSTPGVGQATYAGQGNPTPLVPTERAPATWPAPQPDPSQTLAADAARAAQLAMGAGPGTMFPTARLVTLPNPIQPVSGVATPQSDVRWAYGETTSSQPSPQGVNQAVWHDSPGSNRPAEPPPWNNQLAPPSPWNNWQSPAPPSNNWMIPGESTGGSAPTAAQGHLPTPPPSVLPPPWPASQTPTTTTTAAPPANLSAPLPGTASQSFNPATTTSPQNNSGATTIPNWPYAPQRP